MTITVTFSCRRKKVAGATVADEDAASLGGQFDLGAGSETTVVSPAKAANLRRHLDQPVNQASNPSRPNRRREPYLERQVSLRRR